MEAIGVVLGIYYYISLIKDHKKSYWIGLLALYAQSLFWFFHLDTLIDASDPMYVWDRMRDGQGLFLTLAIFPFILPSILAVLTAVVTEKFLAGLVTFTFFSIIQVIVQGKLSGQDNWGNKLFSIAKMALPLISLLVAVINMLNKFG